MAQVHFLSLQHALDALSRHVTSIPLPSLVLGRTSNTTDSKPPFTRRARSAEDGGVSHRGGRDSYDLVVWNTPYLRMSALDEGVLGPMEEAALTDTDNVGLYARLSPCSPTVTCWPGRGCLSHRVVKRRRKYGL